MIVVIAAMDPTGLIALDGQIPWHYREDFKRFKVLTMGCSVVMGRKTWETLPKKLPGRKNIVLSRQPVTFALGLPDIVVAPNDLGHFLRGIDMFDKPLYVIGGAEVYKAAFESGVVDEVDLTIVPEVPPLHPGVVTRFPTDLLSSFTLYVEEQNPLDPRLTHRRYRRAV